MGLVKLINFFICILAFNSFFKTDTTLSWALTLDNDAEEFLIYRYVYESLGYCLTAIYEVGDISLVLDKLCLKGSSAARWLHLKGDLYQNVRYGLCLTAVVGRNGLISGYLRLEPCDRENRHQIWKCSVFCHVGLDVRFTNENYHLDHEDYTQGNSVRATAIVRLGYNYEMAKWIVFEPKNKAFRCICNTKPASYTLKTDIFTNGGKVKGKLCVFPYIFEDSDQWHCKPSTSHSKMYICATTRNLDRYPDQWGICPTQKQGTFSEWLPLEMCDKPCGGGQIFKKRICLFPPCQGKRVGSFSVSCNTEPCSGDRILTVGGDSSEFPIESLIPMLRFGPISMCKFPFLLEGELTETCVRDRRRRRMWCSLTSNYDKHQKWGYCREETIGLYGSWLPLHELRCTKSCGGGHFVQKRKCHQPPCLGTPELIREPCNMQPCPDCYVGNGQTYRGNINRANDGTYCNYWRQLSLDDFSGSRPIEFQNFCRNPGGTEKHPYCFRYSSNSPKKMYCDLVPCSTQIIEDGVFYTIPDNFNDPHPIDIPCTFPYLFNRVWFDFCLLLNERLDGREKCAIKIGQRFVFRYCPSYFKGRWSNWELIADCTKSCGSGRQISFRRCLLPPCVGSAIRIHQNKPCNTHSCTWTQVGSDKCFLGRGLMYDGTSHTTVTGKQCSSWTSHLTLSNNKLPEGIPRLQKNFCRNPMPLTYDRPWCYLKRGFEYCDVPKCPTREGEIFSFLQSSAPRQTSKACHFPFLGADNKLHSKCITKNYDSQIRYCGFELPNNFQSLIVSSIDPQRQNTTGARDSQSRFLGQAVDQGLQSGKFGICLPSVKGTWSSWSSSQFCSVECGGGNVVRKRICRYPPCSDGGNTVTADRNIPCNTHPCPICLEGRGHWYRGKVNKDYRGNICLPWSQVNSNVMEFNPEKYSELTKNFCRNPGGKFSSPWCFKRMHYKNVYVQVFCDIPHCSDSTIRTIPYTLPDFINYPAYSQSGKSCHLPYLVNGNWYYSCIKFDRTQNFAFCSVVEKPTFLRSGSINKNEFGLCPPHYAGSWTEWQYNGVCTKPCGVSQKVFQRDCLYPPCQGTRVKFEGECILRPCKNSLTTNCFVGDGSSYSGTVNMAVSNRPCLLWSNPSINHHYANTGANLTRNFCRNPTHYGYRYAPWCFVEHYGKRFEYCRIRKCSFYEGEIFTIGGVAGGRPCVFPYFFNNAYQEACIVTTRQKGNRQAVRSCITDSDRSGWSNSWGKCPGEYIGTMSPWSLIRSNPCSLRCGGGKLLYKRTCRYPPCYGKTLRKYGEPCNTQPCPSECVNIAEKGLFYGGNVTWQTSRARCRSWDQFNIHMYSKHDLLTSQKHNFCRNLHPNSYEMPFCMVSQSQTAVCDIPPCVPYYDTIPTVGLGVKGQRCVFPFLFNRKKYHSCFGKTKFSLKKFCRTELGNILDSDETLLKTCSIHGQGVWSAWASTRRCSKPCGGGKMFYQRICRYEPCQGDTGKHEEPCNELPCDKTSNCYDARTKGVEFRGSALKYTGPGRDCLLRQGSACLTDQYILLRLARPVCRYPGRWLNFRFCQVRHCPGTANGPIMVMPEQNLERRPFAPCIFPFWYQGTRYTNCLNESKIAPPPSTSSRSKESSFWCSTISDLNQDTKEWGYCIQSDRGKWGLWSFDSKQCSGTGLYIQNRYCLFPPCNGVTWRYLMERCTTTDSFWFHWGFWNPWTECQKCSRLKLRYRYCVETQHNMVLTGINSTKHCFRNSVDQGTCEKNIAFDLKCLHLYVFGQLTSEKVDSLLTAYNSRKFLGSSTPSLHKRAVYLPVLFCIIITHLLTLNLKIII